METQIPPDVLDRVSSHLAKTFKFSYYEAEDIKQQCWVWALEKQHLYNPRWSWYTFLYAVCYTRCFNLWRDKYRKITSPCGDCHQYYLGTASHPCDEALTQQNTSCSRYSDWVQNNRVKQRVCCPSDIGDYQPHTKCDIATQTIFRESVALLEQTLSADMLSIYHAWLDGQVTPCDEQLLLNEIRRIFNGTV